MLSNLNLNYYIKLARKMKMVAKENPILEDDYSMPHGRYWTNLSSGLRLCFTFKKLPNEKPFWHLSMSKGDGNITQEEIDNCIKTFFSDNKPVDYQPGALDRGILHFFQNDDDDMLKS